MNQYLECKNVQTGLRGFYRLGIDSRPSGVCINRVKPTIKRPSLYSNGINDRLSREGTATTQDDIQ